MKGILKVDDIDRKDLEVELFRCPPGSFINGLLSIRFKGCPLHVTLIYEVINFSNLRLFTQITDWIIMNFSPRAVTFTSLKPAKDISSGLHPDAQIYDVTVNFKRNKKDEDVPWLLPVLSRYNRRQWRPHITIPPEVKFYDLSEPFLHRRFVRWHYDEKTWFDGKPNDIITFKKYLFGGN